MKVQGMQHVYLRFQGNLKCNDLTIKPLYLCALLINKPHMQSTLSEMIHKVTGHCDVVGTKSETKTCRKFDEDVTLEQ